MEIAKELKGFKDDPCPGSLDRIPGINYSFILTSKTGGAS
jgi:hypothetical protein